MVMTVLSWICRLAPLPDTCGCPPCRSRHGALEEFVEVSAAAAVQLRQHLARLHRVPRALLLPAHLRDRLARTAMQVPAWLYCLCLNYL
jgi:hypothetical protein